MKIYHASITFGALKKYYQIFRQKLNVLLSMALLGGDTIHFYDNRDMIGSLILDSGAWSVYYKKSDLKLSQYLQYLKRNAHRFDAYFNFDDDFSTEGFANNLANQVKLEKAQLKPIPVIHNFKNEEIPYYIQAGKYQTLALGSSQTTSFAELDYAVGIIKKTNPDIKIHWFGGSRFDWLIKAPVSSCDTSSWAQTGAYGNIKYWNPKKRTIDKTDYIYVGGRIKDLKPGEFHYVSYPWRKDLDVYLKETFNWDNPLQELLGYEGSYNQQLVNLRYYVELEQRINDERTKRGVSLE
jgi:hypothetical protein